MRFTLINDLSELSRLATELESFGEAESLSPQTVQQINLALDELVTNTINYGYEQAGQNRITVEIERKGDVVEICLSDNAKAFDPFSAKEPDIDADIDDRPVGGLGVFLVRNLMDTCDYRREGDLNVVQLSKKL